MPKVRTPDGRVIDAPQTALRYYQREEGYEVLDEAAPPVVTAAQDDAETGQGDDTAPPVKSANKDSWYEYARLTGLHVPEDPDDITKDELIDLVEKSQQS